MKLDDHQVGAVFSAGFGNWVVQGEWKANEVVKCCHNGITWNNHHKSSIGSWGFTIVALETWDIPSHMVSCFAFISSQAGDDTEELRQWWAPGEMRAVLLRKRSADDPRAIPIGESCINQWPFQDPRLEVPTIYKAYVRPM